MNRWLGHPLRTLDAPRGAAPVVYLTFDDGPYPLATARVLALLARHEVKASFFLVATRAEAFPALAREIQSAGHGIGNHSLDHRYRAFFGGKKRMLAWVRESEARLGALLGAPTLGFRPPAGVRTPELAWALRKCDLPLVLWRERFYDAVMPWTRAKAEKSADRLLPGSIVLLHETTAGEEGVEWLETLDFYIQRLKARGFAFQALTREACAEALQKERNAL